MFYIGVIGEGDADNKNKKLAYEVGKHIAEAGAVLVCGGLSGVMESAAKGAREAGGTTIGILPGSKRCDANRYIDIAIPTGFGEARNIIVVMASDALIAVGGSYGTLSEIAFALKYGRPVVGIGTWELLRNGAKDNGILTSTKPEEAVKLVFMHLK